MATTGFLEQRQASPTSLGIVVLLHAAVIGGVLMVKGPTWVREGFGKLTIFEVPPEPPPPLEPQPQPERPKVELPNREVIDVPERIVPTPVPNVPTAPTQLTPNPIPNPLPGAASGSPGGNGPQIAEAIVPPQRPVHDPVRTDALFDPRFAGDLQPPYPVSEERAEREGAVRLRVTIGANGRVTAAERISATNDAFWRVTERQALARWRFRPATVDGRPVASSKVLTVHFRLDGR